MQNDKTKQELQNLANALERITGEKPDPNWKRPQCSYCDKLANANSELIGSSLKIAWCWDHQDIAFLECDTANGITQ